MWFIERPVWLHGLTKWTTDRTIVSLLQGVKSESMGKVKG